MEATQTKPVDEMTDLEFCLHYIQECAAFIDPVLFREIQRRGLYIYINWLEGSIPEQKAQLYARFVADKKAFGDPEIDAIAGAIKQAECYKAKLLQCETTNANEGLRYLKLMQAQLEYIRDYFK